MASHRELVAHGKGNGSTAMDPLALESKLGVLQCHYTWDLDWSRTRLFRLRDHLQDIGTEEGYAWLGHIYNLQGYVHYKLGSVGQAWRFLGMATEAFRQMRNTVSDEGPWLVVNYGNLAWMHHLSGEGAESAAYLAKVQALVSDYPSPCPDYPHPEVCAEKAWSLMKFSPEQQLQAVDLFQNALRMQPGTVEWQSSYVLLLAHTSRYHQRTRGTLEKMKVACEHDPDNLYLAAVHLQACAQEGGKIGDEARRLAQRVLRKPVSSYGGLVPILRLYRDYVSMDEAIDLAEEAVERHPGHRYLKKCAAVCYKMKLFHQSDSPLLHSLMERAVSLHREVVSLYPDSSLGIQITLANLYARSGRWSEAQQVFETLIHSERQPEETQMLRKAYARLLLRRKASETQPHTESAVTPRRRRDVLEKMHMMEEEEEEGGGGADLTGPDEA